MGRRISREIACGVVVGKGGEHNWSCLGVVEDSISPGEYYIRLDAKEGEVAGAGLICPKELLEMIGANRSGAKVKYVQMVEPGKRIAFAILPIG